MTDADLKELEALLAKATPGEWRQNGWRVESEDGAASIIPDEYGIVEDADKDLVCAMKRGLPSLISTIRELRAELEKRDRVVEAAQLAKSQWEKSSLSDFWSFHEELSAALAAIEEQS